MVNLHECIIAILHHHKTIFYANKYMKPENVVDFFARSDHFRATHQSLFMKLFKTINIDVVKCCQDHFGFDLPSVSWSKREKKFEAKFHAYTIVR